MTKLKCETMVQRHQHKAGEPNPSLKIFHWQKERARSVWK